MKVKNMFYNKECAVLAKKLIRFRRRLEKNKIFFDIAASTLIGGASLVVSYSALNLNDKILAATEVAALPHISIGSRARADEKTNTYFEEELFLSNNGAPLSNLDWQTKTFVVLESAELKRRYVLIPINGYYFGQFNTSNVVGELSSRVGHKNLEKFSIFYDELSRYNKAQPDPMNYYFARIIAISKVKYVDRLGRSGEVYFRDNTKISEDAARLVWDFKDSGRMQEIDSLRFEQLKDAAADPNALMLDSLP